MLWKQVAAISCAIVLGGVFVARADEEVILSVPVAPAGDTVARYVVGELLFRRFNPRYVEVTVLGVTSGGEFARDERGELVRITHRYPDPEASSLMDTLNTANLTTNSLSRRVLTKLQNDGVIPAGTIGGTPGVPTLTPVPPTETPLPPTATPIPATSTATAIP